MASGSRAISISFCLRSIVALAAILASVPGVGSAHDVHDSIVINRVWNYHLQLSQDVEGKEYNMSMSYTMKTNRRNVTLWFLPSMHSLAHGDREFTGEAHGKLKFRNKYDYEFVIETERSTIPRNRKPMPTLFENLVPNIYGEHFYEDRFLSPFHRANRRYYIYSVIHQSDSMAQVVFRPRIDNTQLVDGHAIVNSLTGCIRSVEFKGEFDMIRFTTTVEMIPDTSYWLPRSSHTQASFKCLYNNVVADFNYVYDTPQVIPDSIRDVANQPVAEALSDTIPRKRHWYNDIKHFFGDAMDGSTRFSSGKASVRVSPLFNPLYMSYSKSKGLSYKLSANATYHWNGHHSLSLNPRIGYYTKMNQFYYTLPLTMTYNPQRNGMVCFVWGNGNRISNAKMKEAFNDRVGHDSISMPEFRDQYFSLFNNIRAFDWIQFTTGINYHIRKAVGQHRLMEQAGLQTTYRSFAPYITVHLMPWQERGPVLSSNIERSVRRMLGSNLNYSRYEFDAQYKRKMRGLRQLNLRGGAGFYTLRNTDYFVDYSNFRDNNLPTGWDDDWTGQFQLVDSRWYNESDYYLRGHVSYESPLLCLSWIPSAGRFMESERLYFSALDTEHVHGYYEVGYGFKCRYFSTAVFASFLDKDYQSFECKFTLELFKRW